MRLTIAVLLVFALPAKSLAHSGGLDKSGCHRERKTGNYHCHGGGSASPSNALVPRSGLTPTASGKAGAYVNCAEARAAGDVPVRRGDLGYGPHLDRDNDGVGCEL